MIECVTLNGTAMRVSSFGHRTVAAEAGPPRQEIALVVVLRGAMADNAFRGLLAAQPVRVEIPGGPEFEATVERASHTAAGSGEGAVYRHEVTLRETAAPG